MPAPRLIMKLLVEDARPEARDVLALALKHPRRPELPPYTAGAHVDLHLPDNAVRHYSLYGDPADRSRYRLAVKLEREGRGGSRWLHEALKPGEPIMCSAPRNHFELAPGPGPTLLLGAGIGITPLIAMAHSLAREGADFQLHQFAPSLAAAPLAAEAASAAGPGRHHLHLSDAPGGRVEVGRVIRDAPAGPIYGCGPARFCDAIGAATADRPDDSVRFEAFAPLDDPDFQAEPFTVRIASTGAELPVPAGRSALDVLREAGFEQPSSCEIGVCGSCACGFRAGEPIHRDVVLSPQARRDRFMPCVSRAIGTIELDL